MTDRTMKISFSVPVTKLPSMVTKQENETRLHQKVHFFNMIEGYKLTESVPEELAYNRNSDNTIALLNYRAFTEGSLQISEQQGWGALKGVDSSVAGLAVTIFRQEIGFDERGEEVPLTIFRPVDTYVTRFHIRDYNVANNRYYKYIIYPSNENKPLTAVSATVLTGWSGWSITELHPVDSSMKRFSVTSDDVWLFNANVETGEQVQNIAISQQQTLGTFARYSQAPQNYISSSVSCLLGDVLPASYVRKKTAYNVKNEKTGLYETRADFRLQQVGGYKETAGTKIAISSNDKVDMLMAWRKILASGNPKLLKDRKGQSFLVMLMENSNKPMDNVASQADTISFSWVQIGTLDDVQIVDTSLRGGSVNE